MRFSIDRRVEKDSENSNGTQGEAIRKFFYEWKQSGEQIDDVSLIGVRV